MRCRYRGRRSESATGVGQGYDRLVDHDFWRDDGSVEFTQVWEETVRFFSKDYGRTWRDRVPHSCGFSTEGNPYVEMGPDGRATRMAFVGFPPGNPEDWPYPATEQHFCKKGG